MIKKLGWIAVTGFAVGFVSLAGAYAAGGKDIWNWEGVKRWHGFPFSARCGDATTAGAEPTERRWAWTGGDEVTLALSANVHYRVGEGDEVIVRGPADMLSRVVIDDETVTLNCHGFTRGQSLDITLPGRAFREITIAGAGNVVGENLNQARLEVTIAGSGSVTAKGSADHVEVNIAGSGDAKLAELGMKSLEISVAGSGDAEAAPTESAEVSVMGSGNLTLFSNPKRLETKFMGSGRVINKAPKEI